MRPDGRDRLSIDGPEGFQCAFGVSQETLDRLSVYADLLARWQKTQNLVSPKTLPVIWQRHFADSAQLLDVMPNNARNVWDLGSGAGFPGLILAILLAEKDTACGGEDGGNDLGTPPIVRLIESNGRKCAFLREVARHSGVTVEIHNRRIETPPDSVKVRSGDVITARALAPLERLLTLAAPYFASQSTALFLKGRAAPQEIERAKRSWRFTWNMIPSRTDPGGSIIVLRDLRPV
ncbi:MAG: 16S rRNA (guanine(527)-N(7))-methyltransferase RsmG [Methyloligellaceae bacterium]